MKRLSIALIVVMVLTFVTPALAVYTIRNGSVFHDGLIRFYDEATKKYGYMDTEGNVVIKAQYALANDFFNGNAVVSKQNPPESMIINTRGEVVLKTPNKNYEFKTSLIHGALTAEVREIKNGRLYFKGFVLINEKGKVINSKPVMYVSPFGENGLALVGEGNLPQNGSGSTVNMGNTYYYATWSGNTPVYVANRYYFIDRNGKRVSDIYDGCGEFSEGFAVVGRQQKNGTMLYGYIDAQGKEIVAPKYQYANKFAEGLAPVFNGKYGFINASGDVVVELKYDMVNYFKDGLAMVATGEGDDRKYGYIDTEGNAVIDEIYDDAGSFVDGIAAVQSGIMWGLIDKSGSWVVPPRYELINRIDTGLFVVREPSVPQIVNENGDFIDIVTNGKTYKDGAPVLKVEIPFGDFNMINFLDESGSFTGINGVDSGIGGEEFFVKNGSGMLGIIDTQGNEIVPPIYETITPSEDDSGIIRAGKDGKFGYLSKEGRSLTKIVYDRASAFDGAGIAWKGDAWYIIGPDGTEHY